MSTTYSAKIEGNSRPRPAGSHHLGATSFYIGRAFYNYLGVLESFLAKFGLDRHLQPGMGHVLFALFERDDCNLKDLRERIGVGASTMTKMIRRMESAKIITRHRDPDDGRAWRIRLTKLGRSLQPRCNQLSDEMNAVIEAGVSAKDLAAAKRVLARMNQNMLAYKGEL